VFLPLAASTRLLSGADRFSPSPPRLQQLCQPRMQLTCRTYCAAALDLLRQMASLSLFFAQKNPSNSF
jgi:hypothetical protein